MTLTCEEFLRRFLQHLLPKEFPRIRYFGWLANRRRSKLLPLCRALLPNLPEQTPATLAPQTAVWRCPRCHGPMSLLQRLTAAQLLETEGGRNAPLILPNHQLCFTLSVWPPSQLLELCPYIWKGMSSSVDELLWATNGQPNQNFRGTLFSTEDPSRSFFGQETPLKTHK